MGKTRSITNRQQGVNVSSYVTTDIIYLSRGSGRYSKCISFDFDEAIELYKEELPNLIRESLAQQAKEIDEYKRNIELAKSVGII